jgi:hypothetical protein
MGSTSNRLLRGAASLLFLSVIAVGMALPAAAQDRAMIQPSSAASDYSACWSRLSSDLHAVQQLTAASSQDLAPIISELNDTVGYLDQAQQFLTENQTSQASTAIASANAVLTTVESQIASLRTRLDQETEISIAATLVILAAIVVGLVLLFRWKKKHDRALREQFLQSELDYSENQE